MARNGLRQLRGRVAFLMVLVMAMGGASLAAWIPTWATPANVVNQALSAAALGMCSSPSCAYTTTQPAPKDHPQKQHDPNQCEGASSSVGSPSTGPGMHISIATGNVWTQTTLFTVHGGGETTFDLTLTYDSTKADTGDLGRGWTHALNIYWFPVAEYPEPNSLLCSFRPTEIVVVDRDPGVSRLMWITFLGV